MDNFMNDDALEAKIQDLWLQLDVEQRKQMLGQLQQLTEPGVFAIVSNDDETELEEFLDM